MLKGSIGRWCDRLSRIQALLSQSVVGHVLMPVVVSLWVNEEKALDFSK